MGYSYRLPFNGGNTHIAWEEELVAQRILVREQVYFKQLLH